jgi:hypothetical protein
VKQRQAFVAVRNHRVESALSFDDHVTQPMTIVVSVRGRKNHAPSHDYGSGHTLGAPLRLVVLELVRLVDELFRDDPLDGVCACVSARHHMSLLLVA